MFIKSGYSQPTVNVFFPIYLCLPVRLGPAAPDELCAEIQHRRVRAEQVGGLAFRSSLDQGVEGPRGIGLGRRRLHPGVLEADGEVVGSNACRHDHVRGAAEALEVDVPDPRDVGAVGFLVVQADQEVFAAGEVDRGPQGLVESGRVLGEDKIERATLGFEALLPAEGGANGAQAVGDECRIQAERFAGGESRQRVVAVVQAAQRQLDAHAADAHRQAFEPIEVDMCRDEVWHGSGEAKPISATRGSSALRIARLLSGRRASAASILFAIVSSSPYRSSWSRKRLRTIAARGWISSTARPRLASSISKTPQSTFSFPLASAFSSAAAVAPKMRLAPARLDTTLYPAPSRSQLIRRAVVVLPFVPLITTAPCLRS